MKAVLIRYAFVILACIGVAHASVVTFEGATSYGSAVMPNPYSGFIWSGFGVINQSDFLGTDLSGRSGSGDFYAYNLGGERRVSISTASFEFVTLNSVQFSSYVDDALTLVISGRSRTGDWYANAIQVGRAMILIDFGWEIDRIEIFATSSLGGAYSGDPTKFFMDNLTFNESPASVVSEPPVLLLVLAAMLAGWSLAKSCNSKARPKRPGPNCYS